MKTITFDETKWKLVPVQPTREMLMAALDADNASYDNHQYVLTEQWKDMIGAAPTVPPQEPVTMADEWICEMAKRYAETIVERHGHTRFLFTLAELLALIATLRGKEKS